MSASSQSALSTVLIRDVESLELDDWGPLPEATGEPMATEGKKLWTGEGIDEGRHLEVRRRTVTVVLRNQREHHRAVRPYDGHRRRRRGCGDQGG